jgi:hypothetical protein
VIQPSRHPSGRRRRTTDQERLVLYGIAAVAALVAMGSGAAPTDIRVVDLAYTGGCGALFALAGSRSRRWTWIVTSVATVWVANGFGDTVLALIALSGAVASAWTGRTRWVGAGLTIPLIAVLSDLGSGSFHGSTTLLAMGVASPMLLSAGFHLPDTTRQTVIAGITIAASLAVFSAVVLAAASFLAMGDVSDAIEEASTGFDVAAEGDELTAADHFDAAADKFSSARRILGGPWILPARLVPVIGQHARAGQVIVSEGVSLSETAAEVSRAVDTDTIQVVEGRIDLAAVDALAAPLDRAERALERAVERVNQARSAWLISPIDTRLDELGDRLEGALPAARTASLAATEAPTLLGRDRPVRWFVALTTPAEARGLGGLLGSYATVIADNGLISIETIGRSEDLNAQLAQAGATLVASDDYVERWGRFRPQEFFQDVTLSPDLPSVASVAASLYEQATGSPVDGVIVADPFVLGALLELTGPVMAADRRLDSDSAVDFLLQQQYEEFEDNEVQRVAFLTGLIAATFDAITSTTLPGPRGIAAELGPMVDQDRLGAWWAEGGGPDELLTAAGLDGRFPDPAGGDLLAVIHQNSGQNKIDVYLERSVIYETEHDGDQISGTITITLENTAPASGLPDSVIGSNDQDLPPGTNAMHLSVYTALDILDARIDGVGVDVVRQSEFGVEVTSFPVTIPSGAQVVVGVDVAGRVDDPGRITVVQQPLANTDVISVRPADPDAGPVLVSRRLHTDTVATID